MGRLFTALFALLLALPSVMAISSAQPHDNLLQAQEDTDNENRRVLTMPQTNRRRRVRREGRSRRGIKSAFAKAGRGAGRGGKRFGKNMAKGRPVRAGKELGKGMGSFGKNVGKGVGRTAKRVFKP